MKNENQELINKIAAQAKEARSAILHKTTLAGSGHPGGSMSSLELLLSIYNTMQHNPQNPENPQRDRVVVSHGHISPAVYSTLALQGYFLLEDAITQYRVYGSPFEGHIERELPGIEWSTGNLGQGLSAGTGFAISAHIMGYKNYTYVLMGDGEQQKGQLSEARRFAVKYQLNKLIAIVDYNQLQICGATEDVMPQNIRANWEADGWQVLEVDGHDIAAILETLKQARKAEKPTMILAHTVMGKGVSFMEHQEKYHGSTLSEELLDKALRELGMPNHLEKHKTTRAALSEKDFEIPPKATPHYELKSGRPILYEKATDCRSGWGNALSALAQENQGSEQPIVVVDCDLAGSVKTADFAKAHPEHFLQTGIMEHHAAVMSGAISISGPQVFWADFGMFGLDEVYNMQRLNDINHTNLKTVLTHVGIDVGADGKTHQCIDYISLVRNLFDTGIICPADANQTDRIVRWLIDKPGNFVLAMGRSKLPIITGSNGEIFYNEAYRYEYGVADILREGDIGTVFACGTVAGEALKAVDGLREAGVHLQFVYVSSPLKIDEKLIQDAAKRGVIFSVEDHSINGGLGTSIAEKIVSGGHSVKLHKIGVDQYPRSGDSKELFKAFQLDSAALKQCFEKEIE